jgi:hypothetical protein
MNGGENKSGAGWGILVLVALGIGTVALKSHNSTPSAPGDDPVSVSAERERYPESMPEDPNENARRWREQHGQSNPGRNNNGLTVAQIKAATDQAYKDYQKAVNAGDQTLAAKKYEEYSYWWNRLNAERR